MPSEFFQVDPRTLHLPTSRRDGADPFKLGLQKARHGDSLDGMPPILVIRGTDDRLVISDGVTRATRAAELQPGVPVTVEVIADLPNLDVSAYPTVGDTVP